MLAASIPTRMGVIWGASAGGAYIHTVPVASQIGVTDGAASFTTGFVPLNFTPINAGGVPPFGTDFNGIVNAITSWNQWQAAGAQVTYNTSFSTSISGYPAGALVASTSVAPTGGGWVNTTDGNTNDPDSVSTNWVPFSWYGTLTSGDAKLTFKSTADVGFVMMNDGSIGSASSGATTRANADTAALYAVLWNSVSNTYAPVATGRGASAAADFAANKALTLTKVLGRALIIAGAGSGLTARALGETFGAETMTLLLANLPNPTLSVAIATGQFSHFHSIPNVGSGGQNGSGALGNTSVVSVTGNATLPSGTGTAPLGGSSTAFNLWQPSSGINIMLKL